ncbi:hypothetical protein [Paenibacillus sp. S25]|uniref:hypothetical protein n=1 Tax=Paenibacillus sp. S25 TaxID=2823905 RepID=UPI001C64F1AA|nr:hypothetical protein [Paenibacillus sp. S25]QYK61813.1 hypothetical protein KAI37_02137 [Paenibacillus sp. S25]
MSERTVDLIRTDLQSAKNEAKKNILLPVREVEDLLALVDSLQQQVNGLNEESLANFQTAAERGKQLAERERTIELLTKQITDEVAISAKAKANLHDARALLVAGRDLAVLERLDEALGE